jgi:hypothetical protein
MKALCFVKGKISGNVCFKNMDLGMFFPSLKSRAHINETRFDMGRSNRNNERYVIPMHIKNVWTNKWMEDHRNNFFRLATMILVCSTRKVGDHLRERED